MYCKNCFKKISSRSRFCKYCGAPVQPRKKEKEEEQEKISVQTPPDVEESVTEPEGMELPGIHVTEGRACKRDEKGI